MRGVVKMVCEGVWCVLSVALYIDGYGASADTLADLTTTPPPHKLHDSQSPRYTSSGGNDDKDDPSDSIFSIFSVQGRKERRKESEKR